MSDHTLTSVEFCAGYGGLGLGIKAVLGERLLTIGYCELEGFAQANLVSKMEAGLLDVAPVWPDVRTFPYGKFRGLVDIACAGIPCQPHSHAGKRGGGSDERFLFDDWLAGLELMQPKLIFIENVEGLLSSKMPDGTLCIHWCVERLEGMGYHVEAGIFSASEVGAPHQRKRVFILAHSDSERGFLSHWGQQSAKQVPVGNGTAWRDGVAHAQRCGLDAGRHNSGQQEESKPFHRHLQLWPSRPGELADTGGDQQLPRPRRNLEHNAIQSAQCNDGCRHSAAAMADPQARQQDADNERTHGEACWQAWPSRPGEPQHAWEPPRVVSQEGRPVEHASDWSNGEQPTEQQGRHSFSGSSEEGAMGHPNSPRPQERSRQRGAGIQGADTDGGEIAVGQTQSTLGLHSDESSGFLGQALTLNPHGDSVYAYENISKKIRAREVLFSVWREAISKEIQWTVGGLQFFLAEKILQSGMQLDSFTQRICYFVWCIQTGHEAQGWGLHGMWVYETCGNSSQGQKPIEQFKRELGYAMCQLSYEIALEGRKDTVEAESILQSVREASERAWALSQALPEMEEVWRSSLDQTVWEKGCYIEATSVGNRTDELRLLGNGVVPATAACAFRVLMSKLSPVTIAPMNSDCSETESFLPPLNVLSEPLQLELF